MKIGRRGHLINPANIEVVNPPIESEDMGGSWSMKVYMNSGESQNFYFDSKEDAQTDFDALGMIFERMN